jgi:hypothetical protein
MASAMRAMRVREGYWGGIHYARMSETTGGFGAKYRVASLWLDILESSWRAGIAKTAVLVIDRQAPEFGHDRFRGRPHFAYNRFTRMALENGVLWLYPKIEALQLRVLSDGKSRRGGGDDENPTDPDNFCDYLPAVARRRMTGDGRWPNDVQFEPGHVEEVSPIGPHEGCSDECELMQLTDLVVSSVGAAVRGPSGKLAKAELARRAARWITDITPGGRRGPPKLDLYRRFDASLFAPGATPAWGPPPLAMSPDAKPGQLDLF